MSDALLYKLHDRGWVELFQHDGYVTFLTADGFDTAPCMYFANCDRDAVTTVNNPIMGAVPTCQRCYEFATTT